jgi:predicted Zn-dependent protease
MTALFERLARLDRSDDDYAKTHPPFHKRLRVVEPVIASVPSEKRPAAREVKVRADRFRAEMAALPRRPVTAKR